MKYANIAALPVFGLLAIAGLLAFVGCMIASHSQPEQAVVHADDAGVVERWDHSRPAHLKSNGSPSVQITAAPSLA